MGRPILKPITPKFDGLLEELRHDAASLPESDLPASSVSSPVPVSEVSPGAAANTCRVCGHALDGKDDFCGNCGMLAHSTDDGMQSKWASLWFMQQAKKAVGSEQNRSERSGLPKAGYSNGTAENQNAETDSNPPEEQLAGVKRGPRSVLSVLKLHLKARGMARKLSTLVFLALLKKFS